MGATILCIGDIMGIMDKKRETTSIAYWGWNGDNGKGNGSYIAHWG